jgi:chaperonin GroES
VKKPRPLGNHIIIETVEMPKMTTTGLHLPDQYVQPPGEGRVVAVGTGKLDYAGRPVPIDCRPGDLVVFNWLHARDVQSGNKKWKILDADQILAVMEETGSGQASQRRPAASAEMKSDCCGTAPVESGLQPKSDDCGMVSADYK